MARARDGAAFPWKSSLAMSCLSAALEKRGGTVAETLWGKVVGRGSLTLA